MRIKFQLLHLFSFLFSLLFSSFSCQEADEKSSSKFDPITESYVHYLGNTPVTIKVSQYGETSRPYIVLLHHNEATAASVARQILETRGGTLVRIENKEKRYISFSLNRKHYFFDPNRMFSKKGIRENLSFLSQYHPASALEIEKFAEAFLNKLKADTIIALHNNTNREYSILSYQTDKSLRQNHLKLFQERTKDVDDFFVTTHPELFEALMSKNFNAVLENNHYPVDDGSLSVHLGKRGKMYVNIEAEHWHGQEQKAMASALLEMLYPSEGLE